MHFASAIEHGWPQQPKEDHVNENRNALDPGNPLKMIGQKLRLDQQQQKNRAYNQRPPGDRLQDEPQAALANVPRPGEKLDKNNARQLPPQALSRFRRIAELRAKLGIVYADLRAQHNEMYERIGMRDNENNWCQNKKSDKRQWHVTQKRQFDRIF